MTTNGRKRRPDYLKERDAEIVRLHEQEKLSYAKLGERFQLSKQHIGRIINRQKEEHHD